MRKKKPCIDFTNGKVLNDVKTARASKLFFVDAFPHLLAILGLHPSKINEVARCNLINYSSLNPRAVNAIKIAILALTSTNDAIDSLTNTSKKPYRTILVDLYLKQMEEPLIAKEIGYSFCRYRYLKSRAFNEFAVRFVCSQLKNGASTPIDLRRYA